MIAKKTTKEIEIMRQGGKLLARIMKELMAEVQPGITTAALDNMAEAKILKAGAKPAFLNYHGFPATMCTSVNEEIVHAIPAETRKLQEGDIITLDLGLIYQEFYLDMARTVAVGDMKPASARLVEATEQALTLGIKKVRPGAHLGDIGEAIQRFVENKGYGVVRELCGHGIGRELHEEPQVLNYGKRGTGVKLEAGMVICIEPMVTMGDWKLKRAKDGQTFLTRDGSLSAHFEDTIAVTPNGAEVLTKTP